jgi:DNA-binding transcriptional LysR family regulator
MHNRLRAAMSFLAGFEAAARTLSFTKAAAELSVTQSAMSRQIKALEDALGLQLFERLNRRLVLTAAGQTLQRSVSALLRELAETVDRLAAPAKGNVITVGATVSFAALWLVPRLADFRRAHPGIDVRIAADNSLVDVGTRGIDLTVRFGSPATAPAGATPLFAEEVFPVCAPRLARDAARPLRSPRDLARHVLLHLHDVRRWPWLEWSQWLIANGVSGPEPAGGMSFSHYDQLIQAAVAGEGIALGRTPLIEHLLQSGKLVAPLRGRAATPRQYFLITPPGSAANPGVAAFTAWITAAARHPDTGLADRTRPQRARRAPTPARVATKRT